jgi:sugar/nucleoside kinase (ribokinase family)
MPIESVTGVLCCGNICFDMPVWPVDQITWGTTTWVETITESLGGNGANTSYALATLGVPVFLTGVVGSDGAGDKVLATLRSSGVDTSRIRRSDLPTTSTVCIVHPSGDRLFLHRVGGSTAVEAADVSFDLGGKLSHFHLANPFALPNLRTQVGELLRRAKSAGLSTSLDTGWDARGRWIDDIGPGLPVTDLLFVNDKEAAMLTGEADIDGAVGKLRALGAGDIVVKIGAEGCLVYNGSSRCEVPGFAVDVVDTTGAGDCFAGGFLAALHRGRSYPAAARFANGVGALNVQRLGAAQGVLSFDETEHWIEMRSKLNIS